MKHDEYHRQFAEGIIEQIRQGTAPWQKPWGPGERVLPANVDTGRSYRGGNSLHLAAVAQERGYGDVRWGTYRQIQVQGGQVRKGEQGTRILSFQDHRKIAVNDEELHRKAEAESEPLTLERLFDIYGEEVTPTKRGQSRLHDRAAMKMFLGCFGRDRKPATLSQRDWDRFIRERRAGRVGPSGKPVADRMIERDLKFLIAVLNWAGKSRDAEGKVLLESNPLKGLKTPTEKNPARIVLTEVEYQALLRVSRQVDWRFRVALVLAHETGHRINAIRQLR